MVHMEYYLVVSTFMMLRIYGFLHLQFIVAMLIQCGTILNSVNINFRIQPMPLSRRTELFSPCSLSA